VDFLPTSNVRDYVKSSERLEMLIKDDAIASDSFRRSDYCVVGNVKRDRTKACLQAKNTVSLKWSLIRRFKTIYECNAYLIFQT